MSRPKLLELGGCEGASTAGWQRAGWDVTTVDLDANRLKYNPAEKRIKADAINVLRSIARSGHYLTNGHFQAVSLHPPCQWYTRGRAKDRGKATKWERTIPPWREAVEATGLPYVIENVADAGWDMREPVGLCGCMFDISTIDKSCRATTHEDKIAHAASGACDRANGVRVHLQRLRLFETNWNLTAPRACDHTSHKWVAGVYGGARRDKYEAKFIRKGGYVPADKATVMSLLGVEHEMTWQGLFEAVPTSYTNYVGRKLIAQIGEVAA